MSLRKVCLLLGLVLAASPLAFSQQQAPAGPPINVNKASETELMTLPGVDAAAARRIVAGRPYANLMQLLRAAKLPVQDAQVLASKIVFSDEPPPPQEPAPPPAKEAPKPQARQSGAQSKQGTADYSGASAAGSAPRLEKINVNRASLKQLMTLPGVDEDLAKRIVAGRPYKNSSQFFQTIRVAPLDVQRLGSRIRF